jgi:hypothetical protein
MNIDLLKDQGNGKEGDKGVIGGNNDQFVKELFSKGLIGGAEHVEGDPKFQSVKINPDGLKDLGGIGGPK